MIGGGNAGLCAAISARDRGARVLLLESSPRALRGGNSRHTRNIRCMHEAPTAILTDAYSESEYVADLLHVTKGHTNERLAHMAARASATLPEWLMSLGVLFQPSLRGTLQLGRTNAFFLGGGKALLNSEYAAAERRGVEVLYDTEVFGLEISDRCFRSARARADGRQITIRAKAAVLASGGFESNLDWLQEAWGKAADNFTVRGTSYNTGKVLSLMIDHGAQQVGDARQGLKVDEAARVLMSNGVASKNIFAAGEIMAGNILGEGYVAGVGMMIGTAFGRIAGTEAAIQCCR